MLCFVSWPLGCSTTWLGRHRVVPHLLVVVAVPCFVLVTQGLQFLLEDVILSHDFQSVLFMLLKSAYRQIAEPCCSMVAVTSNSKQGLCLEE